MDGAVSAGPDEFGRELLKAHNSYRAKHGSPPLKWSSEAARPAQEWADRLTKTGRLQHGNHDGMGQNLAFKSGAELTGQEVADMWYKEVSKYDFNRPGFSSGTGHFTQLVWAETTHMGAGRATKGSSTFVVANYVPPGNVLGQGNYERNVKRAN